MAAPRRIRFAKIAAVAWLVASVGITLLMGPRLGLRGWMWLGLQDLLCLLGVSWELWLRPSPSRITMEATHVQLPPPPPGSSVP